MFCVRIICIRRLSDIFAVGNLLANKTSVVGERLLFVVLYIKFIYITCGILLHMHFCAGKHLVADV